VLASSLSSLLYCNYDAAGARVLQLPSVLHFAARTRNEVPTIFLLYCSSHLDNRNSTSNAALYTIEIPVQACQRRAAAAVFASVREKQLKLWSDVVLGYHKARQEYSFAWRDWPLWENKRAI
jgi:hypothetical protein